MFCSQCGAEVAEGEKFCRNCGAEVRSMVIVHEEEIPEEMPAEAAEAVTAPVQEAPAAPEPEAPVGVDSKYEYIMANFYPAGDKMKAISFYKRETGLDIMEVRAVIESMFDGTYVPVPDPVEVKPVYSPLEQYIRDHFDASDKIKAIRYYMDETGAGLTEAKEAVEKMLQ